MKAKLLTLALAAMAAGNYANAQLWSENFNSGFPAGWKLYDIDQLTEQPATLVDSAWELRVKSDNSGNPIPGDSLIVSTSYYTPAGTANDWVVTHSFTVGANTAIKWDEKASDVNFPDGYEVLVSTATDAVGDFTNVIYSSTGAAATFTTRYASLAAFNGQTIYVAFRNNSNNKRLLYIDNISTYTMPANDLSLTLVTPTATSLQRIGMANSNITLGGSVLNLGSAAVTSYTVKYQQGAGPVVSTNISSVNIASMASANFSISTPYTLPATAGDYPITMWVELTGDADNTNDTGNTLVTSITFMPTKKIFIEEGTGTWCGWCPRGAVYMDSLWNNYQQDVTLVAVHNGDPMVVSAYDAFMGPRIGGYPSVLVDRVEEMDPSQLINAYNAYKGNFAYADISLTYVPTPGFTFGVTASVKPALNLDGDYRLALVLTEDDVRGTSSGYAQSNYYSNYAPLSGAGHDWYSEPSKVPAAKMEYEFVARKIVPSPDGAAGSLPASMTANTTYDYTFNTSISPGHKRDKMRAIVILIRNSDGIVLNSNVMSVPLGITDVAAGIEAFSIFPNPTANNSTLKFGLSASGKVSVVVTDAMGRLVKTIVDGQMSAGSQTIDINTTEFAPGVYNVTVQTEKGLMTNKLSVIK